MVLEMVLAKLSHVFCMVTITILWIFRRNEMLEEGLRTIEQASQNMTLAGKVELVTFSQMMQHEH